MSRGLAIALLVSFLLLGARSVRAAEPIPRDRRFAFLDAPRPPLPDLPPEPTREADEYPRRTWEVFPSGGVATPFCRGSAYGLGHCGDATSGAMLGVGALYRVSPYVALGLDLSFARFTPRATNAGATLQSEASFIGLLVRGYFLDRGLVDPYVETGFGQGASVARYAEGGRDVRTESAAPAFLVGAGIDFWLTSYLRLGPALTYRLSWISNVEGCWGSTCTSVGVDERGAVGSYASVSVKATIAFGREM
jgi:hypothetical protein